MGTGTQKKKKTNKKNSGGKSSRRGENIDHGDQETSANKKSKQAQQFDETPACTLKIYNLIKYFTNKIRGMYCVHVTVPILYFARLSGTFKTSAMSGGLVFLTL